jgi:hypothetical protein
MPHQMPRRMLSRLGQALAGLTAAAFLFAVAVPHYHDGGSHAHPTKTCRACKIQDGFVAAPPAAPPVALRPVLFHLAHLSAADAPRGVGVMLSLAPRAPPTVS